MTNQINQAIRYAPIIEYVLKNKPEKILEIWSWSQWIWRFLNIRFDGLDLTSSDYWDKEIETYKWMNFIKWSAIDIPISNDFYDFVYSCDMIEHIQKEDREKAINEAVRVCKKWGYVIICFPCWIIAKIFDYSFFYFYKFISFLFKKNVIPWRLEEHIKIEYPSDIELSKIVNKMKKKVNNVKNYSANNIFEWAIIMFIDSVGTKKLKDKIINIYIDKPKFHKSILPYRKYLIIRK